MADDKKPQHAPAPRMELRPDGATARAVDRAAFTERQKAISEAGRTSKAPEASSAAKREQYQANTKAMKNRAFSGERSFDKSKGPLSHEFNRSGSKNNGHDR